MTATESITLAVALLGALLGVLNAWRTYAKDRPRLRIKTKSWLNSFGESGLCIEAANVGFLDVYIEQVGFTLPGNMVLLFPCLAMGVHEFPHLLKAGQYATFYVPPHVNENPSLATATHAFVRTGTGATFRSGFLSTRQQLAHHAAR